MLVQFRLANYLSFRDDTTFSLVATTDTNHLQNTFDEEGPLPTRLLKSAAIYGANASGKTNLLRAIRFARDLVETSADSIRPDRRIATHPYRLDRDSERQPSEFEFTFLLDGERHVYGFAVDSERVHKEWLTVVPQGGKRQRAQTVFHRSPDGEMRFGRMKGERLRLARRTLPNVLFLSKAATEGNETAAKVYGWLTGHIRDISDRPESGSEINYTSSRLVDDPQFGARVARFLKAADIMLERIDVQSIEPTMEGLKPFFRSRMGRDPSDEELAELQAIVVRETGEDGERRLVNLRSVHRREDGSEVLFDLEDESAGTVRLVSLAGPWLHVLDEDCLLLVDELDTQLHPLLTRFLLQQVHEAPEGSTPQLIFTTHDCSLLDADILRRDQVWFTEKSPEGATCLYPLSDFKVRQEENIRRRYLTGRYGAIPFVGEFSFADKTTAEGNED